MKKIELISRWFINKLQPTPLKLQKLLYFAQGMHFCLHDEELFPEDFEGWVHGPVVREIYDKYKSYGHCPIEVNFAEPELDGKELKTLEEVACVYGKYDGRYLEEITHNQTPWLYSRRGLDPDERTDKTIPKNILSQLFTAL